MVLKSGRVVKKPMIELITQDRLDFIEGGCVNLQLNHVFRPDRSLSLRDLTPFIGRNARRIPGVREVRKHTIYTGESGWVDGWVLPMGQYLVETREVFNMPHWVRGFLSHRTSVFRSFSHIQYAVIHPNYQGKITGLLTVGEGGEKLEWLAEVAQAWFSSFDGGKVDIYRGIYGIQGYRNTTNGQIARPR